ncbi:MAG: DUF460 domain-containing protein [Candidatus Korarchaeota archaeon]
MSTSQRIIGASLLRILGLDILPDRRNFFFVILNSETQEIILKGIVSRGDLIDFIKRNSIDLVAIDNIFELYSNTNEILRFLEETGTTLVQVTGSMFRQRKLASIAKEYDMHRGGKLSPEQAAEIAARLAASKEGAKVVAFMEATLITITRSRSFGVVGGSHQRQYLRAAEARIKAAAKEVLDLLNERGIPYDLFVRQGEGGYKSAKIIVYESFNNLRGIIKQTENDWYQIKIEPISHNKLLFINGSEPSEVSKKGQYLIIGIDPGETTGLAILNLNGDVLYIASRRSIGLFDLIDEIYKHGQPLIISCDVPKVPHFVKMIATQSGAVIYRPDKVLPVSKKNEVARKAGVKVFDSHQRDAYVAAWLAYKHYEKKFSKINALAKYIPFIDADSIKAEVVLKSIDVRSAIIMQLSKLLQEPQKTENIISSREAILQKENSILREKYVQLKEKYEEILKENENLRLKLAESERRISELLKELEKTHREEFKRTLDELKLKDPIVQKLCLENETLKGTITNLENKIRTLESKIEILERIASRENDEVIIKKIPTLSHQTAEEWIQTYGLTRFDFILTHRILFSSRLLEILKESKILGIILVDRDSTPPETVHTLEANGIAVIDYQDTLDLIDKNLLVQKIKISEIRKRIRGILIERFESHEHLYQEFLEILEEYRKKRLEELLNE